MRSMEINCMNGKILNGKTATAYAPINGQEVRTIVINDSGTLYAKIPGADAGITTVDPSKVYIINV